MLPIRSSVLFPGAIVPLTIGRDSSRQLLDTLPAENGWVAVFTQQSIEKDEAGLDDLYLTGVAAQVLRVVKNDDSVVAIVSARERIRGRGVVSATSPFSPSRSITSKPGHTRIRPREAAVVSLRDSALKLLSMKTEVPDQVASFIRDLSDGGNWRISSLAAWRSRLRKNRPCSTNWTRSNGSRSRSGWSASSSRSLRFPTRSSRTCSRSSPMRNARRSCASSCGRSRRSWARTRTAPKSRSRIAGPSRRPACRKTRSRRQRELKRLEYHPPGSPEYGVITVTWKRWPSAVERSARTTSISNSARRFSIATTTAWRRSSGGSRISRRAQAQSRWPRPDPLPSRPARRRQNQPGPVDRRRPGPHVRAHQSGRHARRGGDPRPPPHLHRRHARPPHPGAAPRRHAQSGRHARRGGQARGAISAAIRPAPCSRCSIPRQNQTSPTTISMCRSTCRRSFSSPPPTPRPDPARRCATAWKSSNSAATPSEKLAIAQSYLVPRQLARTRPEEKRSATLRRRSAERAHRGLHPRGRRARTSSARSPPSAAHVAARIAEGEGTRRASTPAIVARGPRPAAFLRERKLETTSARRRHRPGLDARRRRGAAHRGASAFPARAVHAHRPARRRDEGIGAGRLSLVRSRAASLGIDPKEFRRARRARARARRRRPKDGPSAGVAMFTALASLFTGRPVEPTSP